MFASDAQRSFACVTLLANVELEHLWGNGGPTRATFDALEQLPLSSGEQLMLKVALDLWNGRGGASMSALFRDLDEENLRLVATLVLAVAEGPEAVDDWIEAHHG